MNLNIGEIVDGKITGITKFGAFVSLPEGKSGMVHISEVANCYVENIADFLIIGQEVKVKIVAIDEFSKIGLSIKKALPPPPRQNRAQFVAKRPLSAPAEQTFEDKIKQFMQTSDSRNSEIRLYGEKRSARKRS